jgi:FkbM family methyltransferase
MENGVRRARPVFLQNLYRSAMRMTRRRGMRTLSRWNTRLFPRGHLIVLDTGCDMFIPPDPHFFGYVVGHESHITRLIEEVVAEGDTCVDVGANIGYFSLMMAARCGRTGAVYSYEPEPANLRALIENVKIAESRGLRVKFTAAAVSDHAGTVELVRGEESTAHQVRTASESSAAGDLVNSVNLADDLASKGISGPIKLLKIDVEGHEASVLKGCAGLFERGLVATAVIEVAAGDQAREISALLPDFGARSVECWLDGRWCRTPLAEIPMRTDVLVQFG